MTWIARCLTQAWTQDLIMALTHSLWQGVLIVALLYGVLNSLQKAQSPTRYFVGLGALGVLLFCVFATFAILRLEPPELAPLDRLETTQGAESAAPIPPLPEEFHRPHVHIQTSRSVGWQTWAFCVWAVGVCLMLLRMLGLLLGVHRLTYRSVPVDEPAILALINALRTKLGIPQRILVVTGEHILSPGVIGVIRPVLLLPLSLATGVPSEDLKVILLHELTHIRRYDYLVNFFQMLIEALLFFNPCVWWINRQIRLEREACCDAVAVKTSGQRLRYAELLIQWSQQAPGRPSVAAMASFSQSSKRSLMERVKRMALPGHKPQIHLSLLSIVGLLFLSTLVLAGLWKTTDTAVLFAAKLLTPAERAQRIDQIDQSYGAQALEAETERPVTITGTVHAADGTSLPDDFYLSILAQSPRMSASSGTRVRNGKFHYTMSEYYEAIYLLVKRRGFAPTYVGPFHPKPGETLEDIEIVLTHGFPGVIDVVDDRGTPIANAVIKGCYQVFKNSSGGSQDIGNLVTDTNGRVVIPKAIKRPMEVSIRAPGYQFVRKLSVAVEPSAPVRLTLTASPPTTGIILDEQSGQPVANAALRLWEDHTGQRYAEGYGDVWATTDAQGRFSLSTLAQGQAYTFIIESADHQYTRMKQVALGDTDLIVHLKPKRHVRGIVLGEAPTERWYSQETKSWQHSPVLKFYSGFSDEYSWHHNQVELIEVDGRFTFDIMDVYGDSLRIETGDQEQRIALQDKDIEDLIIDLRPVSERLLDAKEVRSVVLQFNPPAGVDCNDTQVSVSAISQAEREAGHWGQWNKYTIRNNQIQLTVPAPGLLSYGRGSYDPFSDKGKFLRSFWIEGQNQVQVPRGDSPLVIDIPFHPAGTIYGKINLPTRNLAQHSSQDVSIQLLAIARPDYMASRKGDLEVPANSHWHPSDRYALAPVPLGGTYVVVARYLFGWIKSQPFSLREGSAIIQYDLDFSKGLDVTGTVLSEKDQPLTQFPVSLRLEGKIGKQDWSTSRHLIHTDHQGRFCFAGVNPDMPGTYSLVIKDSDDYEPLEMQIKPRKRPYRIQLRRAAVVSGRIINSQGQPLPGVTVYANEKTKRTTFFQAAIAAPSGRDGRFELRGLKHQAQYDLRVKEHSLIRKMEITAARDTDLTLTVLD